MNELTPIAYQIVRPIEGKRYVCELGLAIERRLAGPFDTAAEAQAAAGAIEIDHPYYQTRTENWLCPTPEPDSVVLPALPATVAECSQVLLADGG